MKWFMRIVCPVVLVGLVALPRQTLAASITETSAAIGEGCTASGLNSTAMGYYTTASGNYSTAMGYYNTTANGLASTAMGYNTTANKWASTAMGYNTAANGNYSTAMGRSTTAQCDYSTAMGLDTIAYGWYSTAMGVSTTAYSAYETVIGAYPSSYSPASTYEWKSSDRLFVIGNGYGSFDRSNAMVVLKNGSIGIGTSYPTNILELSSSSPKLYFNRESSESNLSGLYWRSSNDDFEGAFVRNNDSGNMELYTNISGGTPRMMITNSGRVGIGTTGPGYLLEVNGSAGKLGGGSWADSSDERLKTHINEINSSEALDRITQLRGVTFEWIHPEEHAEGVKAGILAQELEAVFPDWVTGVTPAGRDQELIPEGEKAKAISFPHDFNAYLIEAIKELKAQNEKQQAEIEELRSLIKELRS